MAHKLKSSIDSYKATLKLNKLSSRALRNLHARIAFLTMHYDAELKCRETWLGLQREIIHSDAETSKYFNQFSPLFGQREATPEGRRWWLAWRTFWGDIRDKLRTSRNSAGLSWPAACTGNLPGRHNPPRQIPAGMGIPDDDTKASTTSNVPTTSRVAHTPPAHGPTSIRFGILLPERGLKLDESGVPIDISVAGVGVEHQHLYDNFDWHQGVRWGVTQLTDRTLNDLWCAVLPSCPSNPARLPQSFYGALANPFEEIECPSTQGSDVTIARFSGIMVGTRATGSKSAT